MHDPVPGNGQLENLEILEGLLDKWEEEVSRGITPDPQDICQEHPELLPNFQELLEGLKRTEWLGDPTGSTEGLRPSILPGEEIIPGYKLVSLIGSGGFGTVWRAVGPGGIPVALKFLWLGEQRTRQEWKALAYLKTLRHPNLLGLFGYWVSKGWLVVGSELADGSLANFVNWNYPRNNPGLSRKEIVSHLRDIAEALDYLHSREKPLVHGDVKPGNLLLVGGRCKLGDFGLVRRVVQGEANASGLSLPYSAPESLLGYSVPQSDQYSLAMTYCHLRGCKPYAGNGLELAEEHLTAKPNLSGLSQGEGEVITKGLAVHPESRFSTCKELIEGLSRVPEKSPGIHGKIWLGALFLSLVIAIPLASIFIFSKRGESQEDGPSSPGFNTPEILAHEPGKALIKLGWFAEKNAQHLIGMDEFGIIKYRDLSAHGGGTVESSKLVLWSSLKIVPGGKIAIAGQGRKPFLIQEWDLQGKKVTREYQGNTGLIRGIAISDDGKLIASGSHDGAVRVFSRENGTCIWKYQLEKHEVYDVEITKDSLGVVFATSNGKVMHTRIGDKSARTLYSSPGEQIWCLVRRPDQDQFYVGGTDGQVLAIQPFSSEGVIPITKLAQSVTNLAIRPKGGELLVGTGLVHRKGQREEWQDPSGFPLVLINPKDGRVLHTFLRHTEKVLAVTWSSDGEEAFSTSDDGLLLKWVVGDGE